MQLSYKNDDDADERLNPSSSSYELNNMEKKAENDIAKKNDDNNNASSENSLNKKEQSQQNLYQPSSPLNNKSSKKKGRLKKYGPGGMLGGLLIGGGALTTLLTPGLLIMHVKETLLGKFNDQVPAMHMRSQALLRSKLDSKAVKGLCKGPVKLRCRYRSMSKRQARKLERAGIEVDYEGKAENDAKFKEANDKVDSELKKAHEEIDNELKKNKGDPDAEKVAKGKRDAANKHAEKQRGKNEKAKYKRMGGGLRGRVKPTGLIHDGKSYTAKNIHRAAKLNPKLGFTLLRGYNSWYAAFTDKIAMKLVNKFKILRGKLFPNSKVGKMKERFTNMIAGKITNIGAKLKAGKDKKGNDTYQDSNGNSISKEEFESGKKNAGDIDKKIKERSKPNGIKQAAEGVKGIATSLSFGLGVIDRVCTGYLLIREVGALAKQAGIVQLSRYFYVFGNVADRSKAGDASPEETEFIGNILTSVNSEGKSATDSYGYKYSAYNDYSGMPESTDTGTPPEGEELTDKQVQRVSLNNEVLRYRTGQIVGNDALKAIIGAVGLIGNATAGAADQACGFQKGPLGQGLLFGAAAVGAVAAIASGGITAAANLLVNGAIHMTVGTILSIAVQLATTMLIDLAAGKLVDGNENGNQAGNAMTSGAGALNASASQGRALSPLNKEQAVEYSKLSQEVAEEHDNAERTNLSPFDAYSNKTFLGKIVGNIIPYVSTMRNGNMPLSIIRLVTNSFASLVVNKPKLAKAAGFSSKEFDICPDADYNEMNLAADPFCNVRYGIKPSLLKNEDSVEIADFMIDNKYVNEDGEPLDTKEGKEYKEYIKSCIERETPIGTFAEDNVDKGEKCLQKDGEKSNFDKFRIFYLDKSVNDGMDDDSGSGDDGDSEVADNNTGANFYDSNNQHNKLADLLNDSPKNQPAEMDNNVDNDNKDVLSNIYDITYDINKYNNSTVYHYDNNRYTKLGYMNVKKNTY